MADKLCEKTIHSAATLSTSHRHKYLAREAWWLNGSARQTVVLQSWVRIRHLLSPYLTAISWWVATWDGTWLRADLCEGQQRRKLRKNEPLVRQKHKKKKISDEPSHMYHQAECSKRGRKSLGMIWVKLAGAHPSSPPCHPLLPLQLQDCSLKVSF
jgi:hypothetical protein